MIRKILIVIGVFLLLAATFLFSSIKYNEIQPAPQIVANFVDLDKVSRITKYRSCAGHTTVPQDGREMKRSMKHYITLYPEYHKENLVEVYSPYDGYIALIFGKEEIWISPERKSLLNILPIGQWMFSVTHVKPREELKMGDKVKAGDLIGYGTFSASEQGHPSFDATYGTMSVPPKKVDNWPSPYGDLDSIFNHMSAEVLVEYKQRGIATENIIISKEARDNKPCSYRGAGPYFENEGSDDWVELKK